MTTSILSYRQRAEFRTERGTRSCGRTKRKCLFMAYFWPSYEFHALSGILSAACAGILPAWAHVGAVLVTNVALGEKPRPLSSTVREDDDAEEGNPLLVPDSSRPLSLSTPSFSPSLLPGVAEVALVPPVSFGVEPVLLRLQAEFGVVRVVVSPCRHSLDFHYSVEEKSRRPTDCHS